MLYDNFVVMLLKEEWSSESVVSLYALIYHHNILRFDAIIAIN